MCRWISTLTHVRCISVPVYCMCMLVSNGFCMRQRWIVCEFALKRESSTLCSAALGSPSVNRDMGTTRPVYISSTLYWDQSARNQGHSQHTGLKRIHTHTIYRRPYVKYLYTGLLGERCTQSLTSPKCSRCCWNPSCFIGFAWFEENPS